MIRLEITGNDPAAFYSEAMNTLLLLANGGNSMFKPASPPERAVDDTGDYVEPASPAQTVVTAEPNPVLAEPPRRGRPKKDAPTIDLAATKPEVHDDPLPDFMQEEPKEQPKETVEKLTLDMMRDRVKAIVAAHKERGNDMPACVAYVRKLFEPFGIKLAAELKETQFADFWAKSKAYLDGTAK